METGRVVQWMVDEGARVELGQLLLSVETDKAVIEVESPAAGVVLRIDAQSDTEYPVGATLAWIGEPGEAIPQRESSPAAPAEVAPAERVTPVARRLADRHGIDADALEGTGPGGRVTKEDVQRAIDSGTAPRAKPAAAAPAADVTELAGIRRTAAQRLSAGWAQTPLVTEGIEVDLTELLAARTAREQAWREAFGVVPNVNDLVLKAVTAALKAHPRLNAAFVDGAIHQYRDINLGVAMDVEEGLVVPVLHGADALDVGEISKWVFRTLRRARKGKLALEDLEGATFTVTNLAPLGVDWFTPVLYPPLCAILGMGRVRRVAVPVEDRIEARDVATLVLSFDHRVLDGAPCARFLAHLRALLEAPGGWLPSPG
jgi:pyruvate dehydrogenase E2 component (dihydrolipoamide acetyltransferase)